VVQYYYQRHFTGCSLRYRVFTGCSHKYSLFTGCSFLSIL